MELVDLSTGTWLPLPRTPLDMAVPTAVRRPAALAETDRDFALEVWAAAHDGRPARVDLATPARTQRARLLDAWRRHSG